MILLTLPWYIRSEIIDLVILKNPKYSLVNREWLKRVVKQHGLLKIVYAISSLKMHTPIPLLAPDLETVIIHRNTRIHWPLIKGCKNINKAQILIRTEEVEEYNTFKNNLMELPPLTTLHLIASRNKFDLTDLMEHSQNILKKLSLNMSLESWFPILTELFFPNLIKLTIYKAKETFVVKDFIKNMPKLKYLSLHFERLCPIITNMPYVTELAFDPTYDDSVVKLDLNLFPDLKKISIPIGMEFINHRPYNEIKKLTMAGSTDYIHFIIKDILTNLKTLDITIDSFHPDYDLADLFPYLKSLVSLKMTIKGDYKFPKNYTHGPFKITSLTLDGSFLITNHLLEWLSNDFKLFKLELLNSRLSKLCPPESALLPLAHLRIVNVLNKKRYLDPYRTIFNQDNYPQVDVISFKEEIWDYYYKSYTYAN